MTSAAPVRAVIVGLGIHGSRSAQLSIDAGIEIVAAVDVRHGGLPLASLVPGAPPHIVIHDSLAATGLSRGDADVALLCLRAAPAELFELEGECVSLGMNVLTIVETVFDLDDLPDDARTRLDDAARAAGVTIVATGSQDVTWAGLLRHVSAQVRDLRAVTLTLRNGVDGYPREFLDTLGVGLSPDEFDRLLGDAGTEPSIAGATAITAARHLGLTPASVTRTHRAVTLDSPHRSLTYEREIPAGFAIGDHDATIITTAEGVVITAILESTAFPPGERDSLQLHIDAAPSIDLEQRVSVPPATVDATLINRIDDVLAAPSGLLSALDLRAASYTHRPQRAPASVRH